MKLTQNRIVGITAVLIILACFFAIYLRLFTQKELWYEMFAAVLGVIITAIITMILLRGQSDNDVERERASKVFEEKLRIYQEYLQTLYDVIKDGSLSDEEKMQLEFQTSYVAMHCSPCYIASVSTAVKKIIEYTCSEESKEINGGGKSTCKKLLMTKKKLPVRFTGQHFTIDKVLIKDAIRQANISNQDTVLDIGAGKGFLTVHLLKIANNVVAIENDTALVEHLRKLFSDARNVQVVGCDFRNFAVPKFPFKVVSNIPYGITSDIFKILMFESLGNFLGGSIVLQLEPTQKLFSRKLYNPYTVFYHTFFDLKLVYEVGPESFLPPPTVKSALLNIKRKHLFFDFKFKAKYLAFISCLLEKPDLSVKTALKSIFRKSQVRSISEKFGLNLNAQIVCLSPSQWLNCFLEMLEVVPEKFHPS